MKHQVSTGRHVGQFRFPDRPSKLVSGCKNGCGVISVGGISLVNPTEFRQSARDLHCPYFDDIDKKSILLGFVKT